MTDTSRSLTGFSNTARTFRNIKDARGFIKNKGNGTMRSNAFGDITRAASREIWKQNYHAYLLTPQWKRKRTAALKRDKNKCRYCGRRATQVHHLSYDRIFQESLYDLASVCAICHVLLTEYGG